MFAVFLVYNIPLQIQGATCDLNLAIAGSVIPLCHKAPSQPVVQKGDKAGVTL